LKNSTIAGTASRSAFSLFLCVFLVRKRRSFTNENPRSKIVLRFGKRADDESLKREDVAAARERQCIALRHAAPRLVSPRHAASVPMQVYGPAALYIGGLFLIAGKPTIRPVLKRNVAAVTRPFVLPRVGGRRAAGYIFCLELKEPDRR